MQFITLERSASGVVFHNVGPAWAKALFCIVTVLTWVRRAGNDLAPSIEVDDASALWRGDSRVPGDSQGHFLKYTSMSSAVSWTVSAPGQEASADHPSSVPRCARTLVASGWVGRPHSSSAALDRPWWRSILGERSCNSQPSTWWTPVLPTGLPRRSRKANASDLAQMVEARSTDASNLFFHLLTLVQHNTQIVHRRQKLHVRKMWMQDLSIDFVQHLLPSYPHELCLVLIEFQSVHLHPVFKLPERHLHRTYRLQWILWIAVYIGLNVIGVHVGSETCSSAYLWNICCV